MKRFTESEYSPCESHIKWLYLYMDKIILKSVDKSDLKSDIKKYPDYVSGPITKNGKLFSVTLAKKPMNSI